MRIYALTKLGKKIVSQRVSNSDEYKVLAHVANNKTATEEELDVVVPGGGYIARRLARDGLLVELTHGGR